MIQMKRVPIDDSWVVGIEVALPKTNLIVLTTDVGYIMCGALDVGLLSDHLLDREIVAARALGVKTIDDLLHAPLESVTHTAKQYGINPGMTGYEALQKMIQSATSS